MGSNNKEGGNVKAQTIKLGNSEYAKVAERIRLFREDSPKGKIETTHQILEDGRFLFKAYVLKDKSKKDSADATGHSLGAVKGQKDFEKLETISVGRSLANLGYLASGEIASSEEMEEYLKYQEEKVQGMIDESKERIQSAKNIDQLKKAWSDTPVEAKIELQEVKDEVKKSFEKGGKSESK